MDHSVAGKPMMARIARLELRVGSVAVEHADEVPRDFPFDDQIDEIVFAVDRGKIP